MKNRLNEGALLWRPLPNGYEITLYALHSGITQLAYGRQDSDAIDESYHYPTYREALLAALAWDGVGDAPVGWFRHVQSGRRRENGDPARETVLP